jgi:16S rRNA (cytidine1402-2'-O)-methyltransferase
VLILAATPIGNLGDASPRLVETMAAAKFIAAEDTRSLLKLANSLGVKLNARLFSLHEHNEGDRLKQILEIAQDETVLVVSDAGMPTVSDPGFLLVRAAVEAKIEITVIPGPSAVLSALAVSGLPTDRFTFEGFLPRKQGDRRKMFAALAREPRTMVFFESPHRILESLEDAVLELGAQRPATVSRELTKKFEHTERGTLEHLAQWAKAEPKGEMVLVIAGAEVTAVQVSDLVEQVIALLADGIKLKEAVAEIAAAAGASKSDLYQLVLDRRKADNI